MCICIVSGKYQYSLWDLASLYKVVRVILYNIVIVSHCYKLVTALSLQASIQACTTLFLYRAISKFIINVKLHSYYMLVIMFIIIVGMVVQ